MIGSIIYYFFLYPLSLLPLWFLYGLSNLIYIILYYVIGYRKKVVIDNLTRSFPEKTDKEIKKLCKEYYCHFSDIIVEGIKNLSISQKELEKRFTIKNTEIVEDYFDKKQSIILTSGHFNNWEWLITIQNILLPHQAIGIGMSMSQQSLDEKINKRRARLGMIVTHSGNYKRQIEALNTPYALLVLGDQSPGEARKSYWTKFLNQRTGFVFGTEHISNTFDLPVIYYTVNKKKRGHYELEFKVICDDPKSLGYGEITEKYVNFLEKDILAHPSEWVWSHKRWKKAEPKDINTLNETNEKNFNNRFPRK